MSKIHTSSNWRRVAAPVKLQKIVSSALGVEQHQDYKPEYHLSKQLQTSQ